MKPAITNSIAFLSVCVLILSPAVLLAAEAVPPASCDIQHGPCFVTTASGMSIELDIQPKPVKSLSELRFLVVVREKDKPVLDASVRLDLSMPGMYMGKNTPDMKQVTDGRYEGNGIITRCMSGRKTWKASVTVLRGSTSETVDFVFEVQ